MSVNIELDNTGYPPGSDPIKATGFKFSIGGYSDSVHITTKITFEDGLELLKQLSEAASLYRNAVTQRLDVTSKLASIESLLEEAR